MKKIVEFIELFDKNSTDSIETRFAKNLILIVSVSCCFCGLIWGALYGVFLGFGLTMCLPLLFVVFVGLAIPIAHFTKNYLVLVYTQLIGITWISAFLQWSIGNIHDSGVVISWSFLGPIGALLFLNKKHALFWMIQFLLIVLISVLVEPRLSNDSVLVTSAFRSTFYLMNLAVPACVVFGACLYFVIEMINQKNLNYALLRTTEYKNKQIMDSIRYAKRIQQAKLPDKKLIFSAFPESFILFKPKDIVSGDFYFFEKKEDTFFIAAVDCTGHGVPGALMSMIGFEKLEDSLSNSSKPSEILMHLNKGVKTALRMLDDEESTIEGMDIALCAVNVEDRIVNYAGANRPLWIMRKGQNLVEEFKATKKAIGSYTNYHQTFESCELKLQAGDTVYLFTDGYADTFGGQNKRKLMTKRFKEVLLETQNSNMQEQGQYLDDFIENWKGELDQVDDILVIGIRL